MYGTPHSLEFNTHPSNKVESFEACVVWQCSEEHSSIVISLFCFFKEARVSSSEDLNGMRQRSNCNVFETQPSICDYSVLPFRMSHSAVIHLLLSLRAFCHLLTGSGNHMTNHISRAPFTHIQVAVCVVHN